jgi:mannose-6-phosphate isomerase-like protein (cupin superfamily)
MSVMTRFTYPHTISNGFGERLTFVRRVPTERGDRLEGYNVVAPGSGPPMHVHHYQDEGFTVRHGRIGFQVLGEAPQFAGPGDSVTFKAGEAHRFWNAGQDDLVCDAWLEPADNIEYFLREIFDATRRGGGKRPVLLDAAYLMRRYRSEYAMLVIPQLVQKLLFPLLVAIGSLTGRYARYADAPEPVVR